MVPGEAEPLLKVSIVPRGSAALGFAQVRHVLFVAFACLRACCAAVPLE
jgi:hypothetical protein